MMFTLNTTVRSNIIIELSLGRLSVRENIFLYHRTTLRATNTTVVVAFVVVSTAFKHHHALGCLVVRMNALVVENFGCWENKIVQVCKRLRRVKMFSKYFRP
jgi:hypothetical protein